MPATPEEMSPLTGQPAEPAPVLAIKIDNYTKARPHTGLEDADLIYVERVEGGLSRLCAIYASTLPETVGPVRSAREHNIHQLRTYDRPALAYSGARPPVDQALKDSPLYPRSHDDHPNAYHRDPQRPSPHNLFVTPKTILKTAPDASPSADIGLCFAATAPQGGTPTREYTVTHPRAQVTFLWSPYDSRWLLSLDGTPAHTTDGNRLGGPTVVILKTAMPLPDDPDSASDSKTPNIETTGRGEAHVLRDGRSYPVTWHRPNPTSPTRLIRDDGADMPLAPGQVWIAYEEA